MAKKTTVNPKNNDDKDDKYFQYVLTVALNSQNKKTIQIKYQKIKPFTGQCNWKEISFPSH